MTSKYYSKTTNGILLVPHQTTLKSSQSEACWKSRATLASNKSANFRSRGMSMVTENIRWLDGQNALWTNL